MARERRLLRRDQVEQWNEEWSTRDRAMVLAAVDAIPDALYVEAADGSHISVYANGIERRPRALGVYPGYIYWLGKWAMKLDHEAFPSVQAGPNATWQALSTFRPNVGLRGSVHRKAQFCDSCFQQLPVTGLCDTCG